MISKKTIRFALATLFMLFMMSGGEVLAQCAMCRSTLENGYSSGNPGIAAGINTGILYLLAIPYLSIIVLGLLWYKSSRNGKGVSGGVA